MPARPDCDINGRDINRRDINRRDINRLDGLLIAFYRALRAWTPDAMQARLRLIALRGAARVDTGPSTSPPNGSARCAAPPAWTPAPLAKVPPAMSRTTGSTTVNAAIRRG